MGHMNKDDINAYSMIETKAFVLKQIHKTHILLFTWIGTYLIIQIKINNARYTQNKQNGITENKLLIHITR